MGFVSQNNSKIDIAKKRLPNKYYIKVVNSYKKLNSFTRVPQKYKNYIRNSNKTTFIMPNGNSFRVIKNSKHNLLLDRIQWAYSSSANLSGKKYNKKYAEKITEIIIYEPNNISTNASKIYRLGIKRIKKIR